MNVFTRLFRPPVTRPDDGRLRVAIVASSMAEADGVSRGILNTFRVVSSVPDWTVSVFASTPSGLAHVEAHRVRRARQLVAHPEFRAADVIIYHYAFVGALFDAIRRGNGRARQIVFFHNVTPEQLVSPGLRKLVRRSFAQLPVLCDADWLWPVSRTNADVLKDAGADPARIEIMPHAVEWPPPGTLGAKPADVVRLLFVGRITQSKGVTDLVEAVALLRERSRVAFRLNIVGKSGDARYRAAVEDAIAKHRLSDVVTVVGNIDDGVLATLYREAHILAIPSYHEGFCLPVIEGMRAGAIPVGYAAYNLPDIAGGLGRLVPTGDVAALADALAMVTLAVAAAHGQPAAMLPLDGGAMSVAHFEAAAAAHVGQFTYERLSRNMIARIRALTDRQGEGAEAAQALGV